MTPPQARSTAQGHRGRGMRYAGAVTRSERGGLDGAAAVSRVSRVAVALLIAALAGAEGCTAAKPNFADGGAQGLDGAAADAARDAALTDAASVDAAVDGGANDAALDGGPDAALDGAAPDAAVDAGGDAGPPCPTGTGDCDDDPSNGCETDLTSDHAHCGSCSMACASDRSCVEGTCRAASIASVALGGSHTCVALSTGHARCWGRDDDGQLGDCVVGSPDRHTPAPVADTGGAPVSDVRLLAAGRDTSCAIRGPDRVIDCWGENSPPRFGPEGSSASVYGCPQALLLVTPAPAATVSASGRHVCALAGGAAQCSGSNSSGELGRSTGGSSTTLMAPIVGLPAISPVQVVAGGIAQGFTLVLLSNGDVYCVGGNADSQCGIVGGTSIPVPTRVDGLTDVAEVGAGAQFACARTTAGRVYCWGASSGGQTGTGGTARVSTPTEVAGSALPAFESIVLGGDFVLALAAGGTEVWGWGDNEGQFGLGPAMIDDLLVPTRLFGDAGSTYSLAAGSGHACVVRHRAGMRDELSCAGLNTYGQVGQPASAPTRTFTTVPGVP